MKFFTTTAALLMAGMATIAMAQAPIVDGTADASYGAALSTNQTDTGFGDNSNADAALAGGSEIDQVFGKVDGGRLYVIVTGNLETNFNKLNVFIDSVAGGANTIDSLVDADGTFQNFPTGLDSFCCGGFEPPKGNGNGFGALQRMDGLTFDTGFEADYTLAFSTGQENVRSDQLDGMGGREESPNRVNFWAMNAHFADLTNGMSGDVVSAGIALAPQGNANLLADNPFDTQTTTLGTALPNLATGELIDRDYAMTHGGCTDDEGTGCLSAELEFVLDVPLSDQNADPALSNLNNHRNFNNTIDLQAAIDNSNTAGVFGDGAPILPTLGDPGNVTTGIEFSIPLSAIGNPTGDIKLTAFINGSGHDYVANQFSGEPLTLSGNLGGDGTGGFTGALRGVDFSTVTGDQFVTIANSATVPGDFDGDGFVGLSDLNILGANFPTMGGATVMDGDANGDGNVDLADLNILGANWNPPPAVSVPEPTALALAAFAAAGFLARRK